MDDYWPKHLTHRYYEHKCKLTGVVLETQETFEDGDGNVNRNVSKMWGKTIACGDYVEGDGSIRYDTL